MTEILRQNGWWAALPAKSRKWACLRGGVTLLSVLLYLFVCAAGGAQMLRLPLFLAAAAIYLYLPGVCLSHWIGPKQKELQPLLSIVYGSALLAASHCVVVRFQMQELLFLIPLVPIVLFGRSAFQRFKQPKEQLLYRAVEGLCSQTAFAWSILLFLYTICFSARNPHPTAAGSVVLNQDMLWNVGNAAALGNAFPAQDIRFSGVRLSYHYLTELLASALSLLSGAECYDVYVFFFGPLFLAAELTALKAMASSYYAKNIRNGWQWLTFLLVGFSCASLWKPLSNGESLFGNTMLRHLVTNINAQATALVFLCGFLCAFIHMSRRHFAVEWNWYALALLSFFLLCVGKGPEAAILVCSLVVTMVFVLAFQKPQYGKALLLTAGCAGLFGVVYFILFSSGSNSMELSIFAMRNSWCYRVLSPLTDWLCQVVPISGYVWLVGIGLCNVVCMVPFQVILWVLTIPSSVRNLCKLDATRILLNGVAAGGFLAYQLFYHTSSSQVYFALVAMIALAILGVEPLQRLREGKRWYRWPVYLVGAVGLLSTVCMTINYTAQAAGQLAVTVGVTQPQFAEKAITAEDEQAMEWLRQNLPLGQQFATNKTSSTPAQTDAITNVYSAFSQRQAYMEGWTYAMTNMGVSMEVLTHKQQVNEAFFSAQTSTQHLLELAEQEGVQCLVYAKRWPGDAPSGLTPAYESENLAIYLLNQQG